MFPFWRWASSRLCVQRSGFHRLLQGSCFQGPVGRYLTEVASVPEQPAGPHRRRRYFVL